MVSALGVGNLPADTSSFIGRRREVSQLRRLLASSRVLTVTGACGVGKTRLALRVARDVRRVFPDGVWLVELSALEDAELLPHTVAGALGLNDSAVDSPMNRLLDYLQDLRLLLVLDNCEHLLDPCARLVGKLQAEIPGLVVLATSRTALGVEGEHVFVVPPMPVPQPGRVPPIGGMSQYDSVRLFAARGAAALPGFQVEADNRRAVAQLCQKLDGIPLALELAAVRLRSLSLDKILDRLNDRFQLLRGTGDAEPMGGPHPVPVNPGDPGGARSPRQRTLWAAVDWSFDLCSPEERALWQRLTVFAGGFDLQAAQMVCAGEGIARTEVFDLVAGLVDKSLLVREGHGVRARYRMLETIRQFGRARLEWSGRATALRIRHRDYYQRLGTQFEAEWFSPRQVEWLTRMQHEHANLRLALECSLSQPGQAQAALSMTAQLRNFWVGSGLVGEGSRWLDAALAADSAPTPARAQALWVAACLALMPGDIDAALVLLRECAAQAVECGDASALAYATAYRGMAALFRGDLPQALTRLEEALERHRATEDLNGISVTLNQLLLVSSVLADPRVGAFEAECLFLCEAHGAQWSRSYVLWAVSLRQWRCGHWGRAVALAREALRLKRLFTDPWGTGLCVEVLAWDAERHGRHETAARLLGVCHRAWQLSGASLSLPGPDMAFHHACEGGARRALGGEGFAGAFREGTRLPLEAAIAYALGERLATFRPAVPSRDIPLPLTPREWQVAQRLAEGLGNREIADVLRITTRTTESHVKHVLAKLGLTSRDQVGEWLDRHVAD